MKIVQPASSAISEGRHRILGCDRSFLFFVLIVTAAFGFVNYYATIFDTPNSALASYAPIVWRAVTSFGVLVGYLFLSWRPYSILRGSMFLIVIGLLLTALVSAFGRAGNLFSESPVFIGFACFDLLIWAIMIMSRYRSGTSLLRIICVVEALDEFGMLAGTVLGLYIGSDSSLALVAYAAFSVFYY
ncbi:hypothetical protein EGYY_07430 [Eggerthella sp. YY7918]|nr:hypothetical protein EGYY_07430 [Eggerthella sp. YY7918]